MARADAYDPTIPPPIGDSRWMDNASCQGIPTEAFFAETQGEWVVTKQAKKVCHTCPVRSICLETFIAEPHGVFGGLTPRERTALRVARRAAAA